MSSLVKGALGYIYSNKTTESPTNVEKEITPEPQPKEEPNEQEVENKGYLKKAVTGIGSGVYTVGSAGVSSVKWIAGTTYNVGSGVVGTVGSVAGGTATAVAGVVGSGASAVISKLRM
ncbi:hypothetical protein Avbf_05955 [Armadillidium vulgare]|nr:hypothetical protein Avbf_05955 [Armadillidium vulgare]